MKPFTGCKTETSLVTNKASTSQRRKQRLWKIFTSSLLIYTFDSGAFEPVGLNKKESWNIDCTFIHLFTANKTCFKKKPQNKGNTGMQGTGDHLTAPAEEPQELRMLPSRRFQVWRPWKWWKVSISYVFWEIFVQREAPATWKQTDGERPGVWLRLDGWFSNHGRAWANEYLCNRVLTDRFFVCFSSSRHHQRWGLSPQWLEIRRLEWIFSADAVLPCQLLHVEV